MCQRNMIPLTLLFKASATDYHPVSLCILVDSSFLFDTLGMVYCTYIGASGYTFLNNIVFFCLNIFLPLQTGLKNSADPYVMQHFAASLL